MKQNKRTFYVFIACVSLSLMIIGATFAYFTANAVDANTVKGRSETITFGMSVHRVTTVDMAYGLIPMKNIEAPEAAVQKCRDDLGNAGCQIYRITINADSDSVMFLDGYVVVTPNPSIIERGHNIETRFTEVYTSNNGESFYTSFNEDAFENDDFVIDNYIKNGIRVSDPLVKGLNHADDAGCLLIENERIGGDVGKVREFYVMIWVYDNNESQDYLQGIEKAYSGEVTFVTAEGNEISATFD